MVQTHHCDKISTHLPRYSLSVCGGQILLKVLGVGRSEEGAYSQKEYGARE